MGWNNSSESCVAKYNGDMVGKANFQSCGEIENNRRFEVVSVNVKGKYHLNQKI